MFIVIEIDRQYCGFGIDTSFYGVRLGFIAIHFINISFEDFIKLTKEED